MQLFWVYGGSWGRAALTADPVTDPAVTRPMNSFYRPSMGPAAPAQPAADLLRRRPVRVTATVGWAVHERLQQRALTEGRSLSNLIAYLLEVGCP